MTQYNDLASLIAMVESGNDQYALRYERSWAYAIAADVSSCMIVHKCSLDTATMLMSCSFGLYQIMGSVIYDLSAQFKNGTEKPPHLIRDYLTNPQMQLTTFNAFVSHYTGETTLDDIVNSTEQGKKFCQRYNGNGSEYLARCHEILSQ